MTKPRTFIIYKTDSADAHGWLERSLQPSGSLTQILSETTSWKRRSTLPQVGDRVRESENLADPGNGVTHGRDSDWKVSRIERFPSQDTDDQIVICYCEYAPIDAEWEELNRGKPLPELMSATVG